MAPSHSIQKERLSRGCYWVRAAAVKLDVMVRIGECVSQVLAPAGEHGKPGGKKCAGFRVIQVGRKKTLCSQHPLWCLPRAWKSSFLLYTSVDKGIRPY